MSLVGLLIWLLIFAIVLWAARSILAAFGIGDPIATIVQVVIVLIFLLALLNVFTGHGLGTLRIT